VQVALEAETFGVKIKCPAASTADRVPPEVQLAAVIMLEAGVTPLKSPDAEEIAGVVGAPVAPVVKNCVLPTPV
jgi:hypothetical protein